MKKKTILIGLAMLGALVSYNKSVETQEQTSTEETVPVEEPQETIVVEYDVTKPETIAQNIVAASGGLEALKALKDVSYTYTYDDLAKGAKDISEEKYIFEGELSMAKYTTHGVHVVPELEGDAIQKFDGEKACVIVNDEKLTDEKAIGTSHFLRKVNFFWLTMMFKMADPGISYEYLGNEEVNGTAYDKLKVTYDGAVTQKEQNDGYILYVNPETKLVDQFLFSLPAFGINDIVLLMKVEYEEINGLQLPTTRKMHAPLPEGGHTPEPVLIQTSNNLSFNNGFTTEEFAIN